MNEEDQTVFNLLMYYYFIEEKLENIGDYIHFTEKNMLSYGLETYNVLFLSCNLFEECMKLYFNEPDSNMRDWKKRTDWVNKVKFEVVTFYPMGWAFKPFADLGGKDPDAKSLKWWKAYNDTKHNINAIEYANLINAIYSLASAGVMLKYYSKKNGTEGEYEMARLFDILFKVDFYKVRK